LFQAKSSSCTTYKSKLIIIRHVDNYSDLAVAVVCFPAVKHIIIQLFFLAAAYLNISIASEITHHVNWRWHRPLMVVFGQATKVEPARC